MEVSDNFHSPAVLTPGKRATGIHSVPVWMFWRREKSLCPWRGSNHDPSFVLSVEQKSLWSSCIQGLNIWFRTYTVRCKPPTSWKNVSAVVNRGVYNRHTPGKLPAASAQTDPHVTGTGAELQLAFQTKLLASRLLSQVIFATLLAFHVSNMLLRFFSE